MFQMSQAAVCIEFIGDREKETSGTNNTSIEKFKAFSDLKIAL